MEIISHRGYWKSNNQKNGLIAFEQSFSLGFGTETDFRDYLEELFISHDIANPTSIAANACLDIYNKHQCTGTLALNIKADGLHQMVKNLLQAYEVDNYFVFDMSIPDTIGYIKHGIKFFSRQSEYEPMPAFYNECTGIWLDAFTGNWYGEGLIRNHVNNGKQVAIVSPELHKRNHLQFWEYLKKEKIHLENRVIICTDLPEQAKNFFEKVQQYDY